MVNIYTFSDKRPDFIYKQYKLLKKNLDDKFRFFVVNAASTLTLKKTIAEICCKHKISELNFPELNTYEPTPACSIPLQWCWNNYIKNDNKNISVILDSDMFLIKKFSIKKYMKNYDIAAHFDKRGDVNYLWNGIMFFKPNLPDKHLVSFREGVINGYLTDVGGNLFYYLNNNKIKLKEIFNIGKICKKNGNTHLLPIQVQTDYKDKYLCEFYEQSFFHYRAGSNWNNMSIEHHYKKSILLEKIIHLAMTDMISIPEKSNYRFHDLDSVWDVDWPQVITPYTRYFKGKWNNK